MTDNHPESARLALHPLISRRWSPRAFDGTTVTRDEVTLLLEAARWAPSAFNAQPWQFLVATRDDGALFETMLDGLVDANRRWAHRAGMIGFTIARLSDDEGRALTWARHDIGLAMGQLLVQATSMDLSVHQMAGIRGEYIRETFGLPDNVEPVTGFVVGHRAPVDVLPEDLAARELAERVRRPQSEFVFRGAWGTPN